MTQDIIGMARQAGMYGLVEGGLIKEFEAFAKLVAAKEREVCAKLCDRAHPNTLPAMLGMQIRARGEA